MTVFSVQNACKISDEFFGMSYSKFSHMSMSDLELKLTGPACLFIEHRYFEGCTLFVNLCCGDSSKIGFIKARCQRCVYMYEANESG